MGNTFLVKESDIASRKVHTKGLGMVYIESGILYTEVRLSLEPAFTFYINHFMFAEWAVMVGKT